MLTDWVQLLSFRVFRLLLSCEELNEPSNKALRLRLLDAISSKLFSKEKSTTSVKVAQRKAFSYFISFARTIPTTIADLGASCAVVRLLAAIAGKSVDLLAELSDVAGEMLKVDWPKSKASPALPLLYLSLLLVTTPSCLLREIFWTPPRALSLSLSLSLSRARALLSLSISISSSALLLYPMYPVLPSMSLALRTLLSFFPYFMCCFTVTPRFLPSPALPLSLLVVSLTREAQVEQLKILLQAYLKHSGTPVAVLTTMSTVVAKAGVDPSAQSPFATLDKATFQTYFKSTIEELVAYFDKVSVTGAQSPLISAPFSH